VLQLFLFSRHGVSGADQYTLATAAGILDMTRGLVNRRATITTALGYADGTGVRVFHGTRDGSLAPEPRGANGFGYDSIFIPDTDPGRRTWAQMTSDEKNKISHRILAGDALRDGLGRT
jgi:non-canonical purine NTP pyrophosphatase (RdgB/HAM1 family)